MVLGLYYATRERVNGKGEGMVFSDLAEVQRALDNGMVEITARVSVRLTEWVKDKGNGDEFVAQTSLVETDGRPCAAVGDPAQGPAVLATSTRR